MGLFSGLIASSVLLMPSYLALFGVFGFDFTSVSSFIYFFIITICLDQLMKIDAERCTMIRESCGELNKGIGNTEERPAIGGQELGRRMTKTGQRPGCE